MGVFHVHHDGRDRLGLRISAGPHAAPLVLRVQALRCREWLRRPRRGLVGGSCTTSRCLGVMMQPDAANSKPLNCSLVREGCGRPAEGPLVDS